MNSATKQAEIKRLRQELESNGWTVEIIRDTDNTYQTDNDSEETTHKEKEGTETWLN